MHRPAGKSIAREELEAPEILVVVGVKGVVNVHKNFLLMLGDPRRGLAEVLQRIHSPIP